MVTSALNARAGKHKPFSLGSEFSYQFTADRTFSRLGRRPETSPARLLAQSRRSSRRGLQLSPEDVIALAQSPTSDVIQHSFGTSLLMLQQGGFRKVKPDKFLDLDRLSRQPASPAMSIRSDLPTPRLAKQIAARVHRKQESRKAAAATQTTASSAGSRRSRGMSRKSSSASIVLPGGDWATTNDPSTQTMYIHPDSMVDRCIRCSEFPDIQIEGRSLSRILTNPNTLMARKHCEILGPESCPDCIRTRSQRAHQRHCIDTSPATPSDVYKLALIHERAPHLSMRQVQRKVYDGEILDRVSLPLRSRTAPGEVRTSRETTQQEFQPEISVSVRKRRDVRSRSFSKPPGTGSSSVAFETIPEASESILEEGAQKEDEESDSEELRALQSSSENDSDDELRRVEYRKRDPERRHRVKLVPGTEKKIRDDISPPVSEKTKEERMYPVRIPLTRRIANIQDLVPTQGLASEKCSKPLLFDSFTSDVVPSKDFFFDIGDLADRLRKTEVAERATRLRHKEELDVIAKALSEMESRKVALQAEANVETGSVDSSESNPHSTVEFNMDYEPPVLFENKGRYLGVKAPQAGHVASAGR